MGNAGSTDTAGEDPFPILHDPYFNGGNGSTTGTTTTTTSTPTGTTSTTGGPGKT
eukprot:CAMPEP_0113897214 /NCGR_PEP_ID=MMETSP0780_2-20120614/18533_1 /TAXON_ID=652834 /ORGANISM="Palpitomonas bilix" /LENGTH=54 /DNA_ID=CAMNT_0000888609 /DNA_START=27 /DNA_END=191 /DNA_ORIENTATION=+ /assembly_acc=CAM_ASM_000599